MISMCGKGVRTENLHAYHFYPYRSKLRTDAKALEDEV